MIKKGFSKKLNRRFAKSSKKERQAPQAKLMFLKLDFQPVRGVAGALRVNGDAHIWVKVNTHKSNQKQNQSPTKKKLKQKLIVVVN